MASRQQTGAVATIAIVAAIGGILAIFTGHSFWALFIELVAVVAGVVGLLLAASPRVGGGITSVVAIVLGIFGLGMSVLCMAGAIVF